MPQRSFDNHFEHHCLLRCEKCLQEFNGDLKRAVHMETECGFRTVSCDGAKAKFQYRCNWTGPANKLRDHTDQCRFISLYYFQDKAQRTYDQIKIIEKELVDYRYRIYFQEQENIITNEEAKKISMFKRVHKQYFHGSHACIVYKDELGKLIHEHINYETDLNFHQETSTSYPKRMYRLNDQDIYYIMPHILPGNRPLLSSFESVHPTGTVQLPITLAPVAISAMSSFKLPLPYISQ